MKFVTKKIHAYLDYPVAVALMTLNLCWDWEVKIHWLCNFL
jgi:hypothetical protein